MKKRFLLMSAAALVFAVNGLAQDVTPANWKFSDMQRGSARGLFIEEGARIGGNLDHNGSGGIKGFRLADELPGAFAVAHWTGDADAAYKDMSEAQKKQLSDFYDAFQIVDGGDLGNILCYQGNSSTAVDTRAVKNASSMSAPNLSIFTQKMNEQLGYYKISISVRAVLNDDIDTYEGSFYPASSWYDPQNLAGSTNPAAFSMAFAKDFNDFWTTYEFELEVKDGFAEGYNLTPFEMKFGMGGQLGNNSLFLLKSLKMVKVPAPTLGGEVKVIAENWSDAPTGISSTELNDKMIVWANNGVINVLDATSTINVFDCSGQLIKVVEPMTGLSTIPVAQKGIYFIKSGATTRKVAL